MTTPLTLASLKEALQQPFAPETIRFLPKEIHQEQGHYVCTALPYANKRIYEDRLNELVFGEWSSPYVPPYAQGNKLVIPATVVILGVAHTDYGEAFFTATGKNGNTREDENTATEAYSQAFRRACAKFGLGRYLYDLPKLKLPYDPKSRSIAISVAERIAWVEKLYIERGFKPRGYPKPQGPVTTGATQKQGPAVSAAVAATPTIQQQVATPTSAPVSAGQPKTSAAVATASQKSASSANKKSQPVAQPTAYPHDAFLDWVAATVARDPVRIQGICDFYHVAALARLNATQRTELTKRLQQQVNQQRSPSA